MSERWTPGPWAINPDDRPGMEWNNEIVVADKPDNRLCFMANPSGDKSRRDEYEANAHLIAAAPDLYAALNHLAAVVAEMAGRGIPLTPAVEGALDEAGAALTKARGKTP